MGYLLIFSIVFFFCFFIYATQSWHGKHSLDNAAGVQKIHKDPVPRVGGLAIYMAIAFSPYFFPEASELLILVSLSALPMFMSGLGDDIMKTVSQRIRFFASVTSAIIFIAWSGYLGTIYLVQGEDVPYLGFLFDFYPFALLIGILALSGLPHALNMIDGINGLASGTFIIMSACLYSLACKDDDRPLVIFALIHLFGASGYFIWNYPRARLFLGDGGAYYLGFAIATGVIMAIVRDESVTAWTGILVVLYPISEAILSIYRRIMRSGASVHNADSIHMHHFIRRSVARPLARKRGWSENTVNPLTGALMWLFPITSCVLARVGQFKAPWVSMMFVIVFFALYVIIYFRLGRIYARTKPTKQNED